MLRLTKNALLKFMVPCPQAISFSLGTIEELSYIILSVYPSTINTLNWELGLFCWLNNIALNFKFMYWWGEFIIFWGSLTVYICWVDIVTFKYVISLGYPELALHFTWFPFSKTTGNPLVSNALAAFGESILIGYCIIWHLLTEILTMCIYYLIILFLYRTSYKFENYSLSILPGCKIHSKWVAESGTGSPTEIEKWFAIFSLFKKLLILNV